MLGVRCRDPVQSVVRKYFDGKIGAHNAASMRKEGENQRTVRVDMLHAWCDVWG